MHVHVVARTLIRRMKLRGILNDMRWRWTPTLHLKPPPLLSTLSISRALLQDSLMATSDQSDTMQAPLRPIFRGLEGTWAMRRKLTSQLPGFPSGIFEGTATLTPSHAFNRSSYLYHEIGTLTTDQGFQLTANRKYIYRFSPEDEKLSAWFVKEENGLDEPDYLYHDLEFQLEQDRWTARADHLCEKDMYWAFYDFRLDDSGSLLMWGLKHQVKGPEKDYSADTVYQRPRDQSA